MAIETLVVATKNRASVLEESLDKSVLNIVLAHTVETATDAIEKKITRGVARVDLPARARTLLSRGLAENTFPINQKNRKSGIRTSDKRSPVSVPKGRR